MTGPPQPIKAPPSSVSLKGPVIMDQRPTCPLGLNAFPLLPFVLALASPPSIPLSAYVYAVLGVPPTQTGTRIPDLSHSYTRAFNSDCGYGSTGVTVNATVYAAPQVIRPDERSSVCKRRAQKKYETDRLGALVLQSSPVPPVS